MVDAGAYVGETMEEFIWRTHGIFQRIHAFEPCPTPFAALQKRAQRLRQEWALADAGIVCVPSGLGDQDTSLSFFESELGNMSGSFLFSHGTQGGSLRVQRLDDYLHGEPVTYLKADIEGFELPMLHGASVSVKTHRPKMAISLYHRLTDMFELPLFLRSLVPDYKMAVRHHSLNQDETVLYCWV